MPKGGSRKGIPNKLTSDVREMILGALNEADAAGGQAYLVRQSKENPTAFLTLVGKIVPAKHEGEVSGTLVVRWEK